MTQTFATTATPANAPSTIESLVSSRAVERPEDVAVVYKRFGRWNEWTWRELENHVAASAEKLSSHGVAPGDVVALIADNCVEWVVVDLAVQRCGAAVMAVMPGTETEVLARNLHGVAVAICGDQEHIDLLSAASPNSVESIFVLDGSALTLPLDSRIVLDDSVPLEIASVTHDGPLPPATHERPAMAVAAVQCAQSPAVDGARVDGATLSAGAQRASTALGLTARDRLMVLDTLGDVVVRMATVYASITVGARLFFAETLASVADDLADVQPTVLVASTDVVRSIRSDSRSRQMRSGRVRRALIGAALRSCARRHRTSIVGWPARVLVAKPLALRHGLAKIRRLAILGAEPLGRDLVDFLSATTVPPTRLWGDVALGGLLLSCDSSSTWTPLPGVVVDCATSPSRLLVDGRSMGETAAVTMTQDREQESLVVGVPGFEQVPGAGSLLEKVMGLDLVRRAALGRSGFSPDQVMVHLEIDFEWASHWASTCGIDFASQRALVSDHKLLDHLAESLRQCNAHRTEGEPSIESFTVSPELWSAAAGTLTPSRDVNVVQLDQQLSGHAHRVHP